MATTGPRSLKAVLRLIQSGTWQQFFGSLAAWSRHQLGRLTALALAVWLAGSLALYLAERRANPRYRSPLDALWNAWLLLFSGWRMPRRRPPDGSWRCCSSSPAWP